MSTISEHDVYLLTLANQLVPFDPNSNGGQKRANLRACIHNLLNQDANPHNSRHYRLEWFQELNDDNPYYSVGLVKFDFVVGYDPDAKKKFSARIGFSIVKPSYHQPARGFYQNFNMKEALSSAIDEATTNPFRVIAAARTSIATIEEAIARTVAVGHQPYKMSDYDMGPLEDVLKKLYDNDVSCIASSAFSNPLHPHIAYELIAQKQGNFIVLHCVGRTGAEIADIRKFPPATIGEIVDLFHDSLSRSYISPEELAVAISRFQPKDVAYFS